MNQHWNMEPFQNTNMSQQRMVEMYPWTHNITVDHNQRTSDEKPWWHEIDQILEGPDLTPECIIESLNYPSAIANQLNIATQSNEKEPWWNQIDKILEGPDLPITELHQLTIPPLSNEITSTTKRRLGRVRTGRVTKRKVKEIDEAQRVLCVQCNKTFTKVCYYVQHYKAHHNGEKQFKCEKCGKGFNTNEELDKHFIQHNATDKRFKCDRCPKQFHYNADLKRHIQAHHIHNGKPHICQKCGKGFCRRDHLRKHIEIHSPEKTRMDPLNHAHQPAYNIDPFFYNNATFSLPNY